jgi:hypothetical protein
VDSLDAVAADMAAKVVGHEDKHIGASLL